jgi:hypothetical protein
MKAFLKHAAFFVGYGAFCTIAALVVVYSRT